MSVDWEEYQRRVPVGTPIRICAPGRLFEAVGMTVGEQMGTLLDNHPTEPHEDGKHAYDLRIAPLQHTGHMIRASAFVLHYWIGLQWLTFIQVMCLDTPTTTEGEKHV